MTLFLINVLACSETSAFGKIIEGFADRLVFHLGGHFCIKVVDRISQIALGIRQDPTSASANSPVRGFGCAGEFAE